MKKLWIAPLALFSSHAMAEVSLDHIIWYAGLAGGVGFNSAEIDHLTETTTSDKNGQIFSQGFIPYTGDTQQFSGVGQAQVGAGLRSHMFYLGVELLAQVTNGDFGTISDQIHFTGLTPDVPDSALAYHTSLNMNVFEPAFDLKPGVFLSKNTMLYGRIGAAVNTLTLEQNAHYNLVNNASEFTENDSTSSTVVALRAGLGIEHHLHDRFNVFMDYVYTDYGDISLDTQTDEQLFIGETELFFDIDTFNTASDVTKQIIMLGFNYYL